MQHIMTVVLFCIIVCVICLCKTIKYIYLAETSIFLAETFIIPGRIVHAFGRNVHVFSGRTGSWPKRHVTICKCKWPVVIVILPIIVNKFHKLDNGPKVT